MKAQQTLGYEVCTTGENPRFAQQTLGFGRHLKKRLQTVKNGEGDNNKISGIRKNKMR